MTRTNTKTVRGCEGGLDRSLSDPFVRTSQLPLHTPSLRGSRRRRALLAAWRRLTAHGAAPLRSAAELG
jgi:hypothetical protein